MLLKVGTAETFPKLESVNPMLKLDMTVDAVGDGDSDAAEPGEVWTEATKAGDCTAVVSATQLELAVDEGLLEVE
jgi:hypothetical protein